MSLEPNPERQLKYLDFIDYDADLSEQERNNFQKQFLSDEGDMIGLAQLLTQESIQQGEAKMLLRLPEKRFGEAPKPIRN